MKPNIKQHFDQVLSNLYINPLERCNLRCKICYTRKTAPVLSDKDILDFISRYEKVKKIETITFCGGEVFTLKYFPDLVNKLTNSAGPASRVSQALGSKSLASARSRPVNLDLGVPHSSHPLFVQIITNGTIDRLDEFANPNFVNLIVSLDGLPKYHDTNRGKGNFEKSIGFIKKAMKLGFHAEIFSIATRQNISQIDEFEEYLCSVLKYPIQVTYHPRKLPAYLLHHPQSNVFGAVDGFDFLTDGEMVKIMKERRTFPPKDLGCYQIALVSDGSVYGCCEGTVPIGRINDDINILISKLKERIEVWEKNNILKNCLGCSQPDFVCGIKKYLSFIAEEPSRSRFAGRDHLTFIFQ